MRRQDMFGEDDDDEPAPLQEAALIIIALVVLFGVGYLLFVWVG